MTIFLVLVNEMRRLADVALRIRFWEPVTFIEGLHQFRNKYHQLPRIGFLAGGFA